MENCMTLVMIVIAPTAISPPYLSSEVLKHTDMMLSVNCMIKGDTPSPIHGRIMSADSFRYPLRIRRKLFPEVRKRSTHTKDTACDKIVARAAPFTPISKPKMRMGSRIMLHTAPIATVSIPVLAYPCALIKALSPREIWTKIVPMA